jgi:hypothetical protein
MADLASALLGSDDVAGATAKQIADLVKEEDVRNRIGAQAAVYTGLVSLVSRSSKPSFAKQQALRAIGNLCFDHDDNRARFAAAGGVSAIIGALEALQVAGGRGCSPEDRVLCAGVILNTIACNLDLAGRFVAGGAIKGLIWLIRTAQSHREKELAFGSISHLAMCPGALAQMSGAGICPLLVDERATCDSTLLPRSPTDIPAPSGRQTCRIYPDTCYKRPAEAVRGGDLDQIARLPGQRTHICHRRRLCRRTPAAAGGTRASRMHGPRNM